MHRVTTYYSLRGLVNVVALSDFTYGEWIIYEDFTPKYHVDVFDTNSLSNIQIRLLIDTKSETIESIVNKISGAENVQLSFVHKPTIAVIKKSELVNLDLKPIPDNWVSNIL